MVLAFLGASRLHLHNFPAFLGVLLVLVAMVVVAFVATADRPSPDDPNEPFLHH